MSPRGHPCVQAVQPPRACPDPAELGACTATTRSPTPPLLSARHLHGLRRPATATATATVATAVVAAAL